MGLNEEEWRLFCEKIGLRTSPKDTPPEVREAVHFLLTEDVTADLEQPNHLTRPAPG